jgi:S-adenosylmethionine hydrolase
VAVLKGGLLTELGNVPIVDISHGNKAYDIAATSYVLKSAAFEFPEGSIHLVSVGGHESVGSDDGFVAVIIKGHYFVAPNNGILQLLDESIDEAVSLDSIVTTFPAKEILVPAVISLWRGLSLKDIGTELENVSRMIPRTTSPIEGGIQGSVIYIDSYGNAVTNINREVFVDLVGDGAFEVRVGRERIRELSISYGGRSGGDAIALFNDQGLLEIAIVTGPANELLGLKYDSPISLFVR